MAYPKTNWENLPSTNTPLNATNLKKIENELEGLDDGITLLSSAKVNKSGDTLTGELQFNNTNDYAAIRKTRTINGVDYKTNFGISAAPSTRIEFQDANENTLGRLDIRNNGLYNGISNRRLPEVASIGWGSSFSFTMTGGHALVMINQNDCLMLWVAGAGPDLNVARLLGNGIQASYDQNTKTVTLKYQDNHSFTGTAIICTG